MNYVPGNRLRRVRRVAPEIVLVLAIVLGGVSLWQAWDILNHLRSEARQSSRIFGTVVAALNDTSSGRRTEILLSLVQEITNTGLPLIVTDSSGLVTACANLPLEPNPCEPLSDDLRIVEYAAELDRATAPVPAPGGMLIHFDVTASGRRLTWLSIFQLAILGIAVTAGLWAFRAAAHRHRDRLWVAMARESAHQLGTPLMSAAAWIERLRDDQANPPEIARHLRADLDRLERVAQRFERIGRAGRRERVGVGALAARVAAYFEPRLPRHANKIILTVRAPSAGPMVTGDPVLIEWALEALVRNSIDALSGRGGHIAITVRREGDSVRVGVEDDGPGVGLDVRDNLFEPGVSTKSGGWGIGLALAHRIVEDVHGGQLRFEPTEAGALFVAEIPAEPAA